ncbi:MAG TPA: winged helix-turn-helix domain-containing protein [Spirillospora sp.]|nr:winged helix-turn-helix domain-containing protein [Spirillospora sp.]
MSIKIHVTPKDLLETRFAYNPLIELSISYRILGKPEWHHLYPKWVDNAQRALHGIKLPFMEATIRPDVGYIPDFLTPTPTVVQLSLEHEIQRMLANPDDLVRKNIQRLIEMGGESDLLQFFLTHPQEALLCLADELRLYWRRALEPYWSSLTAVLEGDVIYHARQMALYGPEQMFNGLETRELQYRDGVIELAKNGCEAEFRLAGDGIQLVPSIFTVCGVHWQIEPEWQPMIIYMARGIGNWRPDSIERNESLELAIGEGRARVLQTLLTPSNTSEVARRLKISAGAASQHLGRLQQAGLVEPHRSGRRVYYRLTNRGAQLLTLFDQAG